MFEQLLPMVLGPQGALVGAVIALVVLWRQSRKDLAAKDRLIHDIIASKDADIAFERGRTAAAEGKLDSLGGLLKDATAVMDKSITLTERTLDRLRSEGRH